MQLIFPQEYVDYKNSMQWFDYVKRIDKRQSTLNFEKIYVFEHDDVYTAGKSIQNNQTENQIKKIHGVTVVYSDRGGLWTWHGKGQVVVYFIYNIYLRKLSLSSFLNAVESIVVESLVFEFARLSGKSLQQLGIQVYADDKKRGFWIKQNNTNTISKIGFIGLRIINGFVCHGISINYDNDLKFFDYINPCGLGDVKITSIKDVITRSGNTNNALDINFFKSHLGESLFSKLDILHGC